MAANNQVRQVTVTLNGKEVISNLKQLQSESRKVRAEFRKTSDPTAQKRLAKEYRNINREIQKQNKLIYGSKTAFASLKNEIRKFGVLALGYLGFSAITGEINQLIRRAAELSDAMAGVTKTTGLTRQQVSELNKEFKSLDTRTARSELLAMAKVAGKLGITGEKDVLGFVSAMDKLTIAMGEDLGNADEVAKKLGKTIEAFSLTEVYNIEDALLKVGSAINHLGKSSTASEGFIVDFTQRLAGVAPMANISIENIMGMGASLEALGQRVESSSTAISKLIITMVKKKEAFAEMANMTIPEFSKLMNEDANEALLRVVENVGKSTNGIEQLTETLGDLGADGQRVISVLGTMANKTDFVRQQQKIANDEFTKGTSVLNEYNLMNETFAAKLAKVQKALFEAFVNMAVVDALKSLVTWFGRTIGAFDSLTEKVEKERDQLNLLVVQIQRTNEGTAYRTKLIKELQQKYPEFLANIDAEKVSNEQLSRALGEANKAYILKIALIEKQEELEDQQKRVAESLKTIAEIELERDEIMGKMIAKTGLYQEQGESTLDFIRRLSQAWRDNGGAVRDGVVAFDLHNRALREANKVSQAQTSMLDQLNDELADYEQRLKNILGIQDQQLGDVSGGYSGLGLEEMGNPDQMSQPKGTSPGGRPIGGGQPQTNFQVTDTGDMSMYNTEEEYLTKRAELSQEIWLLQQTENERELMAVTEKYEKLIEAAETYGLETASLNEMMSAEYLQTMKVQHAKEQADKKKLEDYKRAEQERTAAEALQQEIGKFEDMQKLYAGMSMMIGELGNFMAASGNENIAFQKSLTLVQIGVDTASAMAGAIAAGMRNLDPTGISQTIFITKMIATVLSGMARARSVMNTKDSPKYTAPAPPQFQVEGGKVKKYGRGGRLRGPKHSDPSGGLHVVDPYTGQVQATVEDQEVLLSAETSRINAPIVNALLRKSLNADRTPLNLAAFARENQMQRGGLFGGMKSMFKEGRKRQYDNTQNEKIEQNSKDVSNMNKMLAEMTSEIAGLRSDLKGGKIRSGWDWERYNEGKDDMAEIERKAGYQRN